MGKKCAHKHPTTSQMFTNFTQSRRGLHKLLVGTVSGNEQGLKLATIVATSAAPASSSSTPLTTVPIRCGRSRDARSTPRFSRPRSSVTSPVEAVWGQLMGMSESLQKEQQRQQLMSNMMPVLMGQGFSAMKLCPLAPLSLTTCRRLRIGLFH